MTANASPGRRSLDPDALAGLEVERDFLLRSLRDLDMEHAAGDLTDGDHQALRDDYTRRAAEVIRAIDARQAAHRDLPTRSRRRIIAWVVALLVVGGVAGVLVARSSGSRSPGGTLSGVDISTPREKLAFAQSLMGNPDRWGDAIALYDEVLVEQPANAEALTYKGWLTYRSGDIDTGIQLVENAAAADPSYPDARVFLAIIYNDVGDHTAASEQLAAFDQLDASPMVRQLVDGRGLRAELDGRRLYERLAGNVDAPELAALDIDATRAVAAANWLTSADDLPADRVQAAARLFDIVLAAEPDNVDALVSKGWLLGLTGADDLVAEGLALIDRALELEPDLVEAYLLKAQLLAATDSDAALAVLDEAEALPGLPAGAAEQITDLRSRIQ